MAISTGNGDPLFAQYRHYSTQNQLYLYAICISRSTHTYRKQKYIQINELDNEAAVAQRGCCRPSGLMYYMDDFRFLWHVILLGTVVVIPRNFYTAIYLVMSLQTTRFDNIRHFVPFPKWCKKHTRRRHYLVGMQLLQILQKMHGGRRRLVIPVDLSQFSVIVSEFIRLQQ